MGAIPAGLYHSKYRESPHPTPGNSEGSGEPAYLPSLARAFTVRSHNPGNQWGNFSQKAGDLGHGDWIAAPMHLNEQKVHNPFLMGWLWAQEFVPFYWFACDISASSRENLSLGFATRVESNRTAQPQKQARGLKPRI